MGREVRRVPPGWQHPENEQGDYIPLEGGSFTYRQQQWDEEFAQWQKGLRRSWDHKEQWEPVGEEYQNMPFAEWDGARPLKEDYMPEWTAEEATHYMMYETTTEGTPISPAFATPEELARWLAETNASAFADKGASYDGWLRVARGGHAPSMVMTRQQGIMSGVDAMLALAKKEEP